MVSVEIKIVTTEEDPYMRFHGKTINQSLDSDFWNTQEDAIIKTTGAGFTHTQTVSVAEGSHYVIYGNSAASSYPWHAKIFVNGTRIAEGDIYRGRQLRGDFTIGAPPEVDSVSILASSSEDAGEVFIIDGYVLDQYGGGMSGISVHLFENGSHFATVTSRSEGYYSKSHTIDDPGVYELAANTDSVWDYRDITITEVPTYDGVYIYLQPALDGAFLELHDRSFGGDTIVDTTNTVDGVAFFDGSPYPDFYVYEVRFPPQTIGGVSYLEALTPWFNFATPKKYTLTLQEEAVVAGHILAVMYWIEGMAGWAYLDVYPTPAKVGDEIHLAVGWVNDGSTSVVGHVLAQLKSPLGYPYLPNAVAGQDHPADPHSGYTVQFVPVTLNESGSWEFYGRLTLDGTIVDSKKFNFGVEVAVGIPTTTTINIPDKVAVDEKFNISGILYETESGIPIPNQPINHSYNGKTLGTSITGIDGDYLKEVSIPEAGTWTLKSEFPGTEALQASRALADAVVAATPIETAMLIAGPLAAGIALFIYGTI